MQTLLQCWMVGWLVLAGYSAVEGSFSTTPHDEQDEQHWDILIFSQHWPQTVCHQWMMDIPYNECVLSSIQHRWTIGGIWPRKFNTMKEIPIFCNPTHKFNITTIRDIGSELKDYWPSVIIEPSTSYEDFLEYEWYKHGICASTLRKIGTERLYFKQGLKWLQHYSMTRILTQAKIFPDSMLTFEDVQEAVLRKLHRNPVVNCVYDPRTRRFYLKEIALCFNKFLELIDCNSLHYMYSGNETIITNCYLPYLNTKQVEYPSYVPEIMYQKYFPAPTSTVKSTFSFARFLSLTVTTYISIHLLNLAKF